eukprot:2955771-Rhodomonas_salina.3
MATFYNRGQKALVSVIRVKDPSANLPKHLFEGITTGWSVSKWKSEESRKALVRKAGGTRLRGSELDAAISKTFHAFDSAAHARDGALTLSKEQLGVSRPQVLTGMQNLGVRLSEQVPSPLCCAAMTGADMKSLSGNRQAVRGSRYRPQLRARRVRVQRSGLVSTL